MKKTTIIALCFATSVSVQASFLDNLKEELRPTLNSLLGEETTNSLIGKPSGLVELPEIPKAKKSDNTSLDGLYTKAKREVTYKEEEVTRYNYFYLKEIISAVRQVEASEEEIARWMNVLSQSGSREGVYSALVLDQNYKGLENFDMLPTERVLDFTTPFLEKYINKSITKDKLAQANFYTIKREITERVLRVVDDLFRLPGNEVYDWYGVFSAEMANKFPKVMNNDVRKMKEAMKHKLWAQNVPDQYVKSEILIKLHRVFNTLQSNF